MMLLLTTFFAKPMFKVNKPLFISKQTMDVTWQNIIGLVREHYAASFNNIHVANEYTKIFHDVAWNKFLNSFLTHLNKLAHLCSPVHLLALLLVKE
jgi:hypothetical protein